MFYKLITLVAGFFISLFSLIYVTEGYGLKCWILLIAGMVIFHSGTKMSK
jgi:hypothetical protein